MRISQQAFYRIGVLASILEPSATPAIAALMLAYRLLDKEVDVEDIALMSVIAPAFKLVGISLPYLWAVAALAVVLLTYNARLAPILRYACRLRKPLAIAYVVIERVRSAYAKS